MSKKITIFKEVFDYYYDGEITKEQFADLMLLHYEVMWGNGVDVTNIQDKDIRMIWRTLQHTVKKSAKNAKDYDKKKNDLKTDDLRHDNSKDDNLYQPMIENAPECLREGNFEDFEKEFNNEFQDNIDFDVFLKKNEHKINNIINLKSSPIQMSRRDGENELEKLLKITPKDLQLQLNNIIENKLNKYKFAI